MYQSVSDRSLNGSQPTKLMLLSSVLLSSNRLRSKIRRRSLYYQHCTNMKASCFPGSLSSHLIQHESTADSLNSEKTQKFDCFFVEKKVGMLGLRPKSYWHLMIKWPGIDHIKDDQVRSTRFARIDDLWTPCDLYQHGVFFSYFLSLSSSTCRIYFFFLDSHVLHSKSS